MSTPKPKVFTVSQINGYIKSVLEDDVILSGLFIEAEISNLKIHSSGHVYFALKDENAAINCVMFRSYASGLNFLPENGMNVILYGRVSLYEKTGQYQIYAEFMEPAGKGALYAAFEQLKNKLAAEGLFDQSHKKELPPYPDCIAVITSGSGAALRDIIQIAGRRNKNISLVVVPVLVQGENAARDIAKAIRSVNEWGGADIIILGRGGGSAEDLWAFNEEPVARAIYRSKIPVISAVGHETDFTIADFVADFRAPTPSAAAEISVPALDDLRSDLLALTSDLNKSMLNTLSRKKYELESLLKNLMFAEPSTRLYNSQIYVEGLIKKLNREMEARLNASRLALNNRITLLESVSPVAVLKRGYSLTCDSAGNVISSAESVNLGQSVTVKFHDGTIDTLVTGKQRENTQL